MTWHKEPRRHSLARRGVKTATDPKARVINKNLSKDFPKKFTSVSDVLMVNKPQDFGKVRTLVMMSPDEFMRKAQQTEGNSAVRKLSLED